MTGERTDTEKAAIRQAAMAIIIAMVVWAAFPYVGAALDLPVRFVFLVDMLCLAAFAWALWVIIRVWRAGAGKGN